MNDTLDNDTLMEEKVDSAMRKAAEKVIETAKQTHTSVVVWEHDQIKEIPPEKIEMWLNGKLSPEARA
jgi:3-dehydroquinate dehydratase